MTAAITLDEAFVPGKQFQNYRHLTSVGTSRYQTDIRFDSSHEDQSRCHVDLWTPAGWTNVVTLASGDARVQALPSGYGRDTSKNVDGFRVLHTELLALATRVTMSPA